MSFKDLSHQQQVIDLLQRSLDRGRLGHAYLFTGADLGELEVAARTLAKTLNCTSPPRRSATGLPLDCCDQCLVCRKIAGETHADIHWVRPESKLRVIAIDQVRELMHAVHMKPTEAEYKVAILVAADRLNVAAANAFLKTLEEPPAKCVLILLSTEPQRLLETILSRCLRLSFAAGSGTRLDPRTLEWLAQFTALAAEDNKSLLGRYKLLGQLAQHLAGVKNDIEESLTARSPLQQYDEADKQLVEKWESELAAAVESEYRRQRADILTALEWWFRDVWLMTLDASEELLSYPQLAGSAQTVAKRLKPDAAMSNLGEMEKTLRLLHTNVQETLALEVGLLKLQI